MTITITHMSQPMMARSRARAEILGRRGLRDAHPRDSQPKMKPKLKPRPRASRPSPTRNQRMSKTSGPHSFRTFPIRRCPRTYRGTASCAPPRRSRSFFSSTFGVRSLEASLTGPAADAAGGPGHRHGARCARRARRAHTRAGRLRSAEGEGGGLRGGGR